MQDNDSAIARRATEAGSGSSAAREAEVLRGMVAALREENEELRQQFLTQRTNLHHWDPAEA